MREIIYRGRDSHGVWHYGSFLKDAWEERDGAGKFPLGYIKHHTFGGEYNHITSSILAEVDRDTVTEFTGLYDTQNNPIYEGDIVEWCGDAYKTRHRCKVVFVRGRFEIMEDDKDKDCISLYLVAQEKFGLRVIGNCFDSPEFHKGEW